MQTPEENIFDAAKSVFSRFGFHGTSILSIAQLANTSKTAIHYYYRSKENLYFLILKDLVKNSTLNQPEILWFLLLEMRTNSDMLFQNLDKIEPLNWRKIIEQTVWQSINDAAQIWVKDLSNFE